MEEPGGIGRIESGRMVPGGERTGGADGVAGGRDASDPGRPRCACCRAGKRLWSAARRSNGKGSASRCTASAGWISRRWWFGWTIATNFSPISGEFATVREGFEDSLPKLEAAEREAGEKRFHDLALRLGHKPPLALIIHHVRLFDSENAAVLENRIVVVSGNRIETVAEDTGAADPPGAEVDRRGGHDALARPVRYARAFRGIRRTAQHRLRRDRGSRSGQRHGPAVCAGNSRSMRTK